MAADEYLRAILQREMVDTSSTSPVRKARATLLPVIQKWASGTLLSFEPSGSFAKGTANHSGTDIDFFISLSSAATDSLKEIYEKLFRTMEEKGFSPRKQNVSIHVRMDGYDVDLVPAKRQDNSGDDHSLYRRKADSWTKTNVAKHIAYVRNAGRLDETRIVKLWRNQKGLELPSFYLEMSVIQALAGSNAGTLSARVWRVFDYLRDSFVSARVVDPANSNNVISDDLTGAEREVIRKAAIRALEAKDWSEIVK